MSVPHSSGGTHQDARLLHGQPDASDRVSQTGDASLPGLAADYGALQGVQAQQATMHATGQGMYAQPQHQMGGPQHYHHHHHPQQPAPYQPLQHMPMPPYPNSALRHMANPPYTNYAMPAVPYGQLGQLPPPQVALPPPPPPPRRPASASSAAVAPVAQPARYHAGAHSDPFSLLPLPSHQYAPIGMSYVPYPPPPPAAAAAASAIVSQPPVAAPVPASTSSRILPPPHVYSPLPPPPRRPPPADDAEDLLPLPSAFADRRAASTSGVEPVQTDANMPGGVEGGEEDDEDLPLRLPTPPSDLANGDDGDGDAQDGSDDEPEAGPSGPGGRNKRNRSSLRDTLPAKRARVSATDTSKGAGEEKPSSRKRRGPNKKNKLSKRRKNDEPPPGVETTVDGSWRRKLSRGGWGGPGGTGAGSRPETFLRKLWK